MQPLKIVLVSGAISLLLPLGACRSRLSQRDAPGMGRLLSHVRFLSAQIGPRPAGSAADQAAQDYILEQLQRAGLEARRESFDRVFLPSGAQVAVSTANLVGILPGEAPEAILVAAHHDSRNSSCPGAADDASGVAVMLEAARIFASRPHRRTLVFASFGGEETFGLPGSRRFVEAWQGPPLRRAITLDFVGSGRIFIAPFPVPPQLWANRMLARAEGRAQTGRVSFDPWLAIVPRFIAIPHAADHESFLEKGIPAFNLSCQFPSWIYHTSEDLPQRVEGETLLAARDLVVEMVAEADGGALQPEPEDRFHVPLALFGRPWFLTREALLGLLLAAAILAAVTLARFRREVISFAALGEGFRGVLVCLPLAALAVSGPFLTETLLGASRGLQHPWIAHPRLHVAGAILAGGFTLWLSLFLSRFLRPTTRPGAYLTPAILLMGAMGGSLVVVNRLDAAWPFVVGAAVMLAGAWSQFAIRRLALGLMGAAAFLPFLSPTTYRMILELSGIPLPPHAAAIGAGILFFPWFLFLQHLLCMPEALYARPGGPLFRPLTGLILALLALVAASANAIRPSYDRNHRALVEVTETVDLQRRRAEVALASLESLSSVRLEGIGKLPDAPAADRIVPFPKLELPGLQADVESSPEGELAIRIHGSPPGGPRRVALRIRGEKGLQEERNGSWRGIDEARRIVFPAGREVDEIFRLRRQGAHSVVLEADLSYDSDLLGLRPQGPFQTFRIEARVHYLKRLS
jgi:hypothetical protein